MIRVNLEDLVSSGTLRGALERMQIIAESNMPVILVDDAVTRRFVQFCGGFRAPLRIDLPIHRNVRRHERAIELLGEPRHLSGVLYSHTKDCSSVEEAEALAALVLAECLELPGIAQLRIREFSQSEPDFKD